MARALLPALVRGTRQLLAAQLFLAVLAIALAGWTLTITAEVSRDRDRLRERVVQLEEELAARGVVPPAPAVVSTRSDGALLYPPEVGLPANASQSGFSAQQLLSDLFAPPPPLQLVVLHVRSPEDAIAAQGLVEDLRGEGDMEVMVRLARGGDAGQPAYVYYDGRQSRAAAALAAGFNDSARRAQIPQWSAQLRGRALPAQGEFGPDRLDIVLPALPRAPAAAVTSAGGDAPTGPPAP